MPELALHCRQEADGLYIAGVAMPWDEEIVYRGRKESFAPGGLKPDEMVPLRYGHQRDEEGFPIPIGRVVEAVDTDEGLWCDNKLLDVPIAEHAWHAAKDGLVTGFSAEFRVPGRTGNVGNGRVTDGIMVGLVLTENPAYKGARITNVRARTPRLDAWTETIADLKASAPSRT